MKPNIMAADRIYKTKEAFVKAVGESTASPVRYECMECGEVFYSRWRSKYTPDPECPCCGVNDMYRKRYDI